MTPVLWSVATPCSPLRPSPFHLGRSIPWNFFEPAPPSPSHRSASFSLRRRLLCLFCLRSVGRALLTWRLIGSVRERNFRLREWGSRNNHERRAADDCGGSSLDLGHGVDGPRPRVPSPHRVPIPAHRSRAALCLRDS